MTPSLDQFQDAFVDALYGAESLEMTMLTQQPGFAVYRNTVLKGATDALLANFPTIERLVGTDWLLAAAAIHARRSPPTDARLLHYGADFPGFLDSFEHAREMPYLGDVARLDRLWTQVHCAADEPGFEMSALAHLSPTELASSRLTPRAACRWVWLPDCPAYTIWRVNREQLPMPDELNWQGEGALLTRKAGGVHWHAASAADCAFLDACAVHLPLELAADHAIAVEPTLDLENLIIRLVSADAFCVANPGRPS
ncbi:DNA-binding domain-containing protein [Pseudomonas sp. TMP9]|uniref:DNA-binding domain-containing protein n=1 Tax=Pseudomonas sp. TMP9 TaxID=3133144 RepID=UPI0030CE18FB